MQTHAPTIEFAQPKVFTFGATIIVNGYGLLLVALVFAAVVVVSLMKFSVLTVLIPLAVMAGTAYLLPFGGGNTHIRRLVQSLGTAGGKGAEGFIVQLTLSPRLRSGLRAVLEDADDIGRLTLEKGGARFEGDAVKAFVPYDRIEDVRSENSGLRGGFVYGRRIRVVAAGLPQTEWLEFMERSSLLLPESRRITQALYRGLLARCGDRAAQGSGEETGG